MAQLPVVSVIGLGAMGHAFAANLLKNGFTVRGWNRSPSRGEDLVSAGLALCNTAQQAVDGADVVLSVLTDGDTTHNVLAPVFATMKPGAVLCQMGTIGVAATEKLIYQLAQARPDVVYVDAPVSGTKAPAENAQILVMASGDRSKAQAAEQVFAAIGKQQQWLGEAGASSRMKLVVNSWLIGMMQSLADTMSLAKQLGFSTDDLWQVLEGGPLAAPYAKGKLNMIASGDYTPQMQLSLALKDARLALQAAPGVAMPGLENIASLWQQAVDAGYGEQDLAAVFAFLQKTPA